MTLSHLTNQCQSSNQNGPISTLSSLMTFDFDLMHSMEPWQYRGEGNQNVVIALTQRGQVLRLPKVKVHPHSGGGEWTKERRRLEREVTFVNQVLRPLIGSDFIGPLHIVTLSPSLILDLNQRLKELRPSNRCHKELGPPFATCRTDLTRLDKKGPGQDHYCVEIKAKKGWWLPPSQESPSHQTALCTFCLNQFLKLKVGKATERSAYCPLDLFSGEPVRVIRALLALTQHPQNNFRIFRNGNLVYGDGICGDESLDTVLRQWFASGKDAGHDAGLNLSNFVYLLASSLLKPVTRSEGALFSEIMLGIRRALEKPLALPSEKGGCELNSKDLPAGSVLSRVLKVQRLGSEDGPGGIYRAYRSVCPVHRDMALPEVTCPSKACLTTEDMWLDELETRSDWGAKLVQDYLTGATARDCSLMLTFCRAEDTRSLEGLLLPDLSGGSFEVTIGLADLDSKPVTCIPRHFVAESDMLQAFQQSS